MRIHMLELEKLVDVEETRILFDELPSDPLEVPDLTEESFRRILEGDYTMAQAKKAFTTGFHNFLTANLNHSHHLRRKILDSDIDKFMKGKPSLSRDDSLKRLPEEFHHHAEHFLPKNADQLPPHRPWDHKIELIPGKEPPYHKNRPLTQRTPLC